MISILLLFFVAAFAMIAAGVITYGYYVDRKALLAGKQPMQGDDIGWVEPSELLKEDSLSSISLWDKILARVDYVKIMKARIQESGLDWTVGRLTLLMLLLASITVTVLENLRWSSWIVSIACGIAVALLPYFYVLRVRRKRLETIELQFPEAMDTLSRALRAGHPLAAGLQMLAEEAEEPLAGEMRTTVHERALGMSWDRALDNLAVRVPLVEIATFVAAVKLQNRTGGKLSEVLGRLSETMRDSSSLKSEIRAISAHGKMTGRVLMTLPVGIAVMMTLVNPGYLATMWTNPAGQAMIGGAIILLVIAHFVIQKLVDIRI